MSRLLLRITATVLLTAAALSANAAERVALIIGMSSYETILPLKNTANDARAIADTLEEIGFDVTTLIDVSGSQMQIALEEFAFNAETAELALIYFAGHGIEVQGENYLVPVDAQVRSNQEVQDQSFTLDDLLVAVEKARKMRIVILDSCRNDPFGDAIDTGTTEQAAQPGGGGGLAPADPDRGTLVAFAARDGQVAFDGQGSNSPYAEALIDILPTSDLEISLMFRKIRDRVLSATKNLQEPYVYGSLTGVPFYLAGASETSSGISDSDLRVAWSQIRPDQEEQLLALAETGDTRSLIGLAYMRLNPDGRRFEPNEAYELFSRAAEAGSPEAQFELAKLYEKGIGTEANPAIALDLYRKSADQGFADALNDLGFLHYNGALGLPANPNRAIDLFLAAANLRHPQAMFNVAALIDDGMIPGKDPEHSAGYLYDALRAGSSDVLDLLTEQPNMFKQATRRKLQTLLQENGFYDGGIDGDFGQGTQRGLRAAFGFKE